jgi:hypothetical protein
VSNTLPIIEPIAPTLVAKPYHREGWVYEEKAFIDSDPGLTQIWLESGKLSIPRHDTFFTHGETVGTPDARFTDCGLRWHYVPPGYFSPAGR